MTTIKTLIVSLALASSALLSDAAQLQNQLSGTTNNCVTGNTNSYARSEDVFSQITNGIPYAGSVGPSKFLQCDVAKDFVTQLSFISMNTGSAASTNTFKIVGSEDATHWTNYVASYVHTAAALTTNYVTAIIVISNCPTAVALRSVEMPTQANTTTTITNLQYCAKDKK